MLTANYFSDYFKETVHPKIKLPFFLLAVVKFICLDWFGALLILEMNQRIRVYLDHRSGPVAKIMAQFHLGATFSPDYSEMNNKSSDIHLFTKKEAS